MNDGSTFAFIAFVIASVAFCVLVIAFVRSTMWVWLKEVAKEHAKTYTVAYLKCGALMGMAGYTGFKEAFQPVTAEAAIHFAWWDWAIKFGAPWAAMLAVLVAFLDNSIQKHKETVTP